ncbi:MAG: NAD(P)/FAD-dependent oxidoreductase, partial [Candidatus Heimdallarchaeaceae archaeon]
MELEETYDIAVIGGGPAGSSAAYYATKYGLRTILFEKHNYPRDKPCGGALSPRTMKLIGKKATEAINCEVGNITIYSPSLKKFVNMGNECYFVIREQFDAAMAEDAKEQGAKICEGELVQQVKKDENGQYTVTTNKRTIKADYIIMATGVQNNKLIRSLGIRKRWEEGYLAMCVNSETKINNEDFKALGVEETSLQIFFGIVPKGYGWYFVKDGYVNIGIGATWINIKEEGAKDIYNKFIQQLRELNLLPQELELAKSKSHTLVFKKPAKQTIFDKILLVGDAAGFVSPVTGE